MAVSETKREQDVVYGKLIALEGDEEILATQLRLLPPSEKFLVIPSITENFPDKGGFNPQSYVHAVHLAFEERAERARAFLRTGTSAHPRLVFMNGGSVSARSRCISRICQHTGGNMSAAENVFNEAVKNGVLALMKDVIDHNGQTESKAINHETEKMKEVESPRQKFMKAAECLKLGTANKQLTEDLGSSPAHAMGVTQSAEDIPAPRQDHFTTEHGDKIRRTVLEVPPRDVLQKRGTFGSQYEDTEYDPFADIASPGEASFLSGGPPTPAVVYGEACLVDMASASPTAPRRAQSVDRFYPSNSRFLEPPLSPGILKHTTSAYHLRKRPGTSEGMSQSFHDSFTKLPRTTFVKASETTIRKSPTSVGSLNSSSASLQGPRIFIDRGTDAGDAMENVRKTEDTWEIKPLIPVFPVREDFILQLFDGQPHDILESVIRTAKDGTYPAIPLALGTPPSPFSEDYDSPASPMSAASLQHRSILRPPSHLLEATDKVDYAKEPGFDLYASHDDYPPDIKRRCPQDKQLKVVNGDAPPTPTLTSSPMQNNAEKLFNFSPVKARNAINVQNSLRQMLSAHFPAGEYSQHFYPVSPEAERLWKPVFRNDEHSSIGNEGRTVDQILALGCEDGVKRDFFLQISGQIGKLGSKRDGTNRSGTLDIGYLIAQVMHMTSSCGCSSTTSNLSDSKVLAALLIPQIEAFLASNFSTRFLILHYPLIHLETIFELRKLLGADLFKVAGIVDSLASDPPSMSRPRTPPSSNNPLSNDTVAARNKIRLDSSSRSRLTPLTSLKQQTSFTGGYPKIEPKVSLFSKANFVLLSTATDAEITAFLSGIWKALMQKSPFYTPERDPELKPAMPERPSPPPPTPSASSAFSRDVRDAHDRDSEYPSSTYRGAPSKISRLTGSSGAGSQSSHEPSVVSKHKYASSIASTKTTRTEMGRRRVEKGSEDEWNNFYIGDDDSDDDEYDKMILGRAMAKIVPEVTATSPKRDKKKALKWLGLA
ncbi:hypothetical protein N431DRAFT_375098 [Stipitochalara longipes BDJ]|nr:hypothetical protein N431DRAFT_375098 [Stipitochalara longipes BDJ]